MTPQLMRGWIPSNKSSVIIIKFSITQINFNLAYLNIYFVICNTIFIQVVYLYLRISELLKFFFAFELCPKLFHERFTSLL